VSGVPVSLALVAGALATLNPCGFPLLPAFLSFYVGAREERVSTRSRVLGGLLVALGILAIAGRAPGLPVRWGVRTGGSRGTGPMLLFGIGYGIASLGCTLPVFLAVVGSAASGASTALVFAAYGAGMAVVVTALALAAALLREGLARRLRSVLPYMSRVAGALLVVAGGYLAYYWYRVGFGPAADLADDPVILFVTRFTARVSASADGNGWLLVAVAGGLLAAFALGALLRVTWRPCDRR